MSEVLMVERTSESYEGGSLDGKKRCCVVLLVAGEIAMCVGSIDQRWKSGDVVGLIGWGCVLEIAARRRQRQPTLRVECARV